MKLLPAAVAATGFLASGAPLRPGSVVCTRVKIEIRKYSIVYCSTLDKVGDCPGKEMKACTEEEAIVGWRSYQVPSTD